MPRASIWDGTSWVSMTGGSGEGAGGPDDTYLRLDSANNPASPNNYLTTTSADLLYFPIGGGDIFGDMRLIDDTPSQWYLSPNETVGYRIFANVSNVADLGMSFRKADNTELLVLNGDIGLATFRIQLEITSTQGLVDRRIRNVTVSDTVPAGQLGDIWFDTAP